MAVAAAVGVAVGVAVAVVAVVAIMFQFFYALRHPHIVTSPPDGGQNRSTCCNSNATHHKAEAIEQIVAIQM